MEPNEKRHLMSEAVKPILSYLTKRMGNKVDALKAYDGPINKSDPEIRQIREIEAVKLRNEIQILKDLIDVFSAMYPEA